MGKRGPQPNPLSGRTARGLNSLKGRRTLPVRFPNLGPATMPGFLSPEAVKFWKTYAPELEKRKLLDELSAPLFAGLAEQVATVRALEEILKRDGMLIPGRGGRQVRHPAFAELLKEAEDFPLLKTLRAEKADAILATRTEAAGKIEVLKKERDEVLPKLIEDRAEKEELFKRAKAALDAAGSEYQTARVAITSRSQSFDHAIGRQEHILFESADPALAEAITFFRDKLDWLRAPGRISTDRRGGETNIFTEKVTLKVASNIDAINSAMAYCRAALGELERMKLLPAMDSVKIAALKEGVPRIDVFTESTGEKPMPGSVGMPRIIPRFGGAANDEYEQTLLDRIHKKANDFLSKPTIPKPGRK